MSAKVRGSGSRAFRRKASSRAKKNRFFACPASRALSSEDRQPSLDGLRFGGLDGSSYLANNRSSNDDRLLSARDVACNKLFRIQTRSRREMSEGLRKFDKNADTDARRTPVSGALNTGTSSKGMVAIPNRLVRTKSVFRRSYTLTRRWADDRGTQAATTNLSPLKSAPSVA